MVQSRQKVAASTLVATVMENCSDAKTLVILVTATIKIDKKIIVACWWCQFFARNRSYWVLNMLVKIWDTASKIDNLVVDFSPGAARPPTIVELFKRSLEDTGVHYHHHCCCPQSLLFLLPLFCSSLIVAADVSFNSLFCFCCCSNSCVISLLLLLSLMVNRAMLVWNNKNSSGIIYRIEHMARFD